MPFSEDDRALIKKITLVQCQLVALRTVTMSLSIKRVTRRRLLTITTTLREITWQLAITQYTDPLVTRSHYHACYVWYHNAIHVQCANNSNDSRYWMFTGCSAIAERLRCRVR